ncbi:SRPBCC family protein [Streptomyces sp. SBT349]|uniref:SRPBCC family protein n=1 Tax=Streptomyces sp. SBT349 TaxID=1580539 RepID=UPI00066EDFC7|nr:SRPBCC family protein [Streptomyces sp. SBT349]
MDRTAPESRHLSTHVDRPAEEVYAYASDPTHLPEWAAGLGSSIRRADGGRWTVESPMGRLLVTFTPRNEFGVLDHDVTLPSGETVSNPVRVIADGAGCEVVFTLRRRPGMSEEDFRRDADAVSADLATLKRLVERA